MAIFTASFFEPEHHHGSRIAIARSIPRKITVDDRLEFLVPSTALLRDWYQGMTEENYKFRFWQELQSRWPTVLAWIHSLQPDQDATLLCWERAGEFCHRNLVIRMIQKYRPECFDGADVARLNVESEKCSVCSTPIIPGLDYCYCPRCQVWGRPVG